MSELKVGDRVAVYGVHEWSGEKFRIVCRIKTINGDLVDAIETSSGKWVYANRKEVRKLVKKPKREFWLRFCVEHNTRVFQVEECAERFCDKCEIVKVREVKKPK